MAEEIAIDPNRLFAAADALLEAMDSAEGMNALVEMRLDDGPVKGGPFTRMELVRAMSLLIRLGLGPGDVM